MSHLARRLLLLSAGLGVLAFPASVVGGEALVSVEGEFRAAVRRASAAAVACVPWGVPRHAAGFSSGVIVTSDGLVLSDGDAGLRWRQEGERIEKTRLDDVEVRVPRSSAGGYRVFRARVLTRDLDADVSLLKILQPPASGLPFAPLGRSDDVEVGDFALAIGTAFDEASRAPATLTAGIVAAADPLPADQIGGRYAALYTSAAVNQGVNGGPVVDVDGRVIGTVSSWVEPGPSEPHQFLGRVVPVDRIRARFAGRPEGRQLTARRLRGEGLGEARRAHALQTVFRAAGRAALPSIASLQVTRRQPVSSISPTGSPDEPLPRYGGPVSGIFVSADGWIVTSLYSFTNVGDLVEPLWDPPEGASVAEGLRDVIRVTVHLSDGRRAPARIVGHDERWGIVVLKAELTGARVIPPAPPSSLENGRFVLAVGNPYGALLRTQPLMTMGILSKAHGEAVAAAWRGSWQTDAAGLDSNVGGPVVDLEGRLLGMLQLWHTARHGRNSGIAFVVPWTAIRDALPALQAGRTREKGFLGVSFAPGRAPRIGEVVPGSAAERAGLVVGDLFHRVGSDEVATIEDVISAIGYRFRDEVLEVTVERDGRLRSVSLRLGRRGR